jgi:hypothetical protein
MTKGNALVFVFFGLVMWLLPTFVPSWFPANGIDGFSTRALWTQAMAVVQGGIGFAFLTRHTFIPALDRWMIEPAPLRVAGWEQAAVPANAVPVVDLAAAEAELLQQRTLLAARRLESNGLVALRRQHAALWRALKVALLDEKRFVHFLERLRLFAHRHGDRAHADGSAAVVLGHHAKHAFVHLVEASGIDFEQLKRSAGDSLGDAALGSFLREITHEIDQVVGDARRAA